MCPQLAAELYKPFVNANQPGALLQIWTSEDYLDRLDKSYRNSSGWILDLDAKKGRKNVSRSRWRFSLHLMALPLRSKPMNFEAVQDGVHRPS